jgi:Right handed beta helix region
MTTQLSPLPVFRAWDNLGLPLVGGKLFTYVAGTTTKQATFTDSTGGTPNTNPVILNYRGEANIWLDPTKVYKLVLAPSTDTDPPTNPFWTVDQISGGSLSPSGSIIPTVDNLFTLGNTSFSWANVYVGPNHAPIFDPVSGNIGYYARTAAEIAASVTPVNFSYAPGVVERYGTNATPGTTDMTAAIQNAANANATVIFQATTYLMAGITLPSAVTFQGQGFGTVLLDKTHVTGVTTYSNNMFTATAAIDYITFKDLTLDGACNNANPNTGDNSEIPLVKITATSKVTFSGVKITRYCGSYNNTPKAISASYFEAIVVQNAARTAFLNCLIIDNHYEVILVWNAPGSHNEVLIDGCLELNTGTPNAHSAFDLNGGHITVTNCVWNNTGNNSQLNIQVAESVRVANCAFLSMQAGAAAQCNIGQDTFPYNSNVLIENNYFLNANSAAISVGPGSSIVIRGNVIDTPGNYGVKLTSGVFSFTTFLIEYPEWPAPSTSGSNSIVIESNIINGVNNGGTLPCGIWLHTVTANAGFWFKDVQIRGNTVTAGAAPNNTNFGLRLDDCQDMVIRDNWLQYTISGLYFETVVQNVLIEGNTFNGVPPNTNNDVIWVGAPTSSSVRIRRNRWNQWPVGANATINVFAGAVTGLEVIDNINIHPTLPVQGPASTAYVQYQTNPNLRTTTVAPAAGDFGIADRISNVPTAAQPIEYVCTVPGSFGSALTCTATGTTPNNFFTCSAIGQLHVGQRVVVAGAGPAAANLTCLVAYITGSTFYIDTVISTSVAAAAMSLQAPTFIKSGNYT